MYPRYCTDCFMKLHLPIGVIDLTLSLRLPGVLSHLLNYRLSICHPNSKQLWVYLVVSSPSGFEKLPEPMLFQTASVDTGKDSDGC